MLVEEVEPEETTVLAGPAVEGEIEIGRVAEGGQDVPGGGDQEDEEKAAEGVEPLPGAAGDRLQPLRVRGRRVPRELVQIEERIVQVVARPVRALDGLVPLDDRVPGVAPQDLVGPGACRDLSRERRVGREKGPRTPVRSRAPMPVKKTLPPLRGFVASDLIFGGGLAITLLLFAVWGINRVMVMRSQQPAQATQPSISDLLASTPLPTLPQQVTVIPAQDTPAVTEIPSDATATLELATLNPNVKVQVVLTATQSTYMRITVDGKVKFEGRAEMGSSYSYDASNQVEVLTGNAAALKVTYNGQDLGLMGNFGEVADRLYTAEGIATPTPTAQPTRTPTPRVTATPTQTLTHTPSPTAAP